MKKTKAVDFKVVYLPHIAYTVYFRDMKHLKGDVVDIGGAAFTTTVDTNASYVFLREIKEFVKEPHNLPLLAHEIVHVLQNICRDRMMDFEKEQENMAYFMSFLLNEVFGYSYDLDSRIGGAVRKLGGT